MKLEDQCVSLELAKKLKELGVKQESYVKWCVWDKNDMFYTNEKDRLYTQEQWEDYADEYSPPESKFFSAFTSAELGELLPRQTYSKKRNDEIQPFWQCELSPNQFIRQLPDGYIEYANTETDVRAKMLICLLENGLLTQPEKGSK